MVVVGSDLIFPNNEECWPALANVWDKLLSIGDTASSDMNLDVHRHDCVAVTDCCQVVRQPRYGYLSYEQRSAEVIVKFSQLLAARNIECTRCTSEWFSIPSDIHVYKLYKQH